MRINLAMAVALALMAIGCNESSNPVAQYGDAMTSAYSAGKVAGEVADISAIKTTISLYYETNQHYPASLEEIAGLMKTELPADKYAYNPATGIVVVK